MCTEKCRNVIAPKKFLFCFSLKLGSVCIGILMCIAMLISLICSAVQVYETSQEKDKSTFSYKNNYGFSTVAVVYSLVMVGLCVWFIWGAVTERSTVVVSWLVVMTLWLAQMSVFLFVLVYLHSLDSNFIGWLLALIFSLVAVGILVWCLLVVLGYWIQLKDKKKIDTQPPAAAN